VLELLPFIGLLLCSGAVLAAAAFSVLVLRSRRKRRGSRGASRMPAGSRRAAPSADSDELDTTEPEDDIPASIDELPYTRRRYLLTRAERDFFDVLRAAAPEGWYVFPQVRLANLVLLKKGTRNWKPHFSRVAQKCVDFVLCDAAEVSPRLVVELDDASHDRSDRQARDAFVDAALHSAGLPVLHVRWRPRYDRDEVARQIGAAVGVPAPTPKAARQRAEVPVFPSAVTSRPMPQRATLPVAAEPAQSWACGSCGKEVSATAKFCVGCGVRLKL
jgi:hypothetical protein